LTPKGVIAGYYGFDASIIDFTFNAKQDNEESIRVRVNKTTKNIQHIFLKNEYI